MSFKLLQLLVAFGVTLALLRLFASIAPRLSIVDPPNHRKLHQGEVPLVGGLAVFGALLLGALLWGDTEGNSLSGYGKPLAVFFLAGGILIVAGLIDDMRPVSVFSRILVEVAVALLLIEGLELRPTNLGDLFGTGDVRLTPWVAYPFTVICVFGVINAYNMLDGMDGVVAVITLITLAGFHLFCNTHPGLITIFLSGALFAFLVSNLDLSPRIPKTFLGDAGSKLMGLIVVTLLLAAADANVTGVKYIEPVTALYLVGLPLYDMTFVTLRRVARGRSPIAPDRTHIHHLMQTAGINDRRALILIATLGATFPTLGFALASAGAATHYQFWIFLGFFILYCLFMREAWRGVSRSE
ncbi:undecaprenyl-phosphate alpha-N-acetylglucosaminyl 1-phosphate transferase [Pseudohaliea rubra]|uniref:Undecaprenyl-phosphate N-acetylglucosaminyl 1-phosphate transferase n=1 Tax=Pseudohaliea rubra DSM 19751 TaxID=1265313 RepID=A0A095XVV8_9GAMM|nr:undecaprenyl-phosphate alpha-N-acetylglucosaminyl 1-phosphate transferase [Pseudohaliea rubra]KGE03836.1 Undecaprenyl-phosphate N-acetylglucosaminyl 1-phosphate transferase [Pseudohaliea rubra DSM 19751]